MPSSSKNTKGPANLGGLELGIWISPKLPQYKKTSRGRPDLRIDLRLWIRYRWFQLSMENRSPNLLAIPKYYHLARVAFFTLAILSVGLGGASHFASRFGVFRGTPFDLYPHTSGAL